MPRLADAQPALYFQHQLESHAYATAQLADHAPQQVAQGYQSRQVSPLSSNNGSPTSPKPYHRQRLRPLYMPAVLRPNEHPYKGCHGSKNEDEPQTPGQEDDRPLSSANSFMTLPGLSGWGRLGRRTTGDSEGCTESEWDLDLFPKPTAPPTRLHWKVCFRPQAMSHLWCLFYTYGRHGINLLHEIIVNVLSLARPRSQGLRRTLLFAPIQLLDKAASLQEMWKYFLRSTFHIWNPARPRRKL